MIERYTITPNITELKERFALESADGFKPRYNAAPTQILPVITSAATQGLSFFYWGTSPEWSKNKTPGEKLINTRVEFFEEKPALKRALKKARCIVPADGFYSWKRVGKKTTIPYRFALHSRELFSFAGLWEEFEDTEGQEIQTFSIVTLPTPQGTETLSDRIPAILLPEAERIWLSPDADETQLLALLTPVSPLQLNHYPVGPGIANVNHDYASMIIATPPADQHGNLTLFD